MRNSTYCNPSILVRLSLLFGCAVLTATAVVAPVCAQSSVAAGEGTKTEAAPNPEGLAAMLGSGALSEDTLEHVLGGKTLYLRGGYMDDALEFDETGQLQTSSPHGSFTLALIRIEKIRLSKKDLKIEGIRYGLHFRGELATEDLASNTDQVRITPKKKKVKITIAREKVIKPKKHIKKKGLEQKEGGQADEKAATAGQPETQEEEVKTVSQEQADALLRAALGRIFAPHIDDRLVAAMPAAWQGFFAVAHHTQGTAEPEPGVLPQSAVDQQARLTAPVEPSSNDYAQKAGIAGMALYHTVVDANGRADRVTVARPIGFGLDENAVKAIEQAKFQPAIKNSKPVTAEVDVVVQFRIYSKRTNVVAPTEDAAGTRKPILPGPYSVPHS
ncbi:MAG TPA: energy transducer TonB [Terracidiphilus sp.]|nr:energy transducer TonB [Terracidiphilus sp.]